MKADELQENILRTYFTLRVGIVGLSVSLPLILYVGGSWWGGVPGLANSISAYYGEHNGAMRDWFVGILWTVGWFLYMYKGFSALENVLLNLAGGFAVGIAMIPCNCWDHHLGHANPWHAVIAVSFFVAMGLVCLVCAGDTIKLLPDKQTQRAFTRRYHGIGIILVASPLAGVIVSYALHEHNQVRFFVEAFGVWTFGYYWWTKSREFRITSAEQLAAQGKVENRKGYGLVRVDVTSQP
jgi:hypothetical protein